MIKLDEYYSIGDKFYKAEGESTEFQDETHKACALVMQLIGQNEEVKKSFESKPHYHAFSRSVEDDPFYHSTIIFMSPPRPWWGGCCHFHYWGGSSSKRDRNDNSDTAAAVALALAIIALVASLAVSVALAATQALDTKKVHKQLKHIEQLHENCKFPNIQNIYKEAQNYQKGQFTSQALKTTFTVITAVGICFLTIAAFFAFQATINHTSVCSSAITFALIGGGTTVSALGAHLTRYIIAQYTNKDNLEHLNSLYDQAQNLQAPHPYRFLDDHHHKKVTVVVGETRFVKEDDQFRKEEISHNDSQYTDYLNFVCPEQHLVK